ncbi:hypothetical protein ACTXIM_17030 [Pseudoalteromonas nigrifaciens]|jgi:hypothetical protein|uniref:hypothetical protein n=1 Tax=Pseudoalteromonas nigrifaciens TaxID=28109 RepID=UPI003FCF2BE5
MLKRYWIWSSVGLLALGAIEAWLSNLGYTPFSLVLAGLNSMSVLIIKGVTGFVSIMRHFFAQFSELKQFSNQSQFRNDFKVNANCSAQRFTGSSNDEPLDFEDVSFGLNKTGDILDAFGRHPMIELTHPLYHFYEEYR